MQHPSAGVKNFRELEARGARAFLVQNVRARGTHGMRGSVESWIQGDIRFQHTPFVASNVRLPADPPLPPLPHPSPRPLSSPPPS